MMYLSEWSLDNITIHLLSFYRNLAEIPVFPTVTAIITLERYEQKETPVSKFLIPRDYEKVNPFNHSFNSRSCEHTRLCVKCLLYTFFPCDCLYSPPPPPPPTHIHFHFLSHTHTPPLLFLPPLLPPPSLSPPCFSTSQRRTQRTHPPPLPDLPEQSHRQWHPTLDHQNSLYITAGVYNVPPLHRVCLAHNYD